MTTSPAKPSALKHLSGLDATFLYLETPQTPMHVGGLHLCELPAGFKGSFHTAVVKHLAKRMHLSPIFTRKLVFMPLNLGHPIWMEDGDFDISRHILAHSEPTTVKQLEAAAAKLHGQLLDRQHPLWQFHIFEHIKQPNGTVCAAFYSKIHHAALDGQGGTVLANAILDISSTPREVAPPDLAHPRRAAGDLKIGEMIGAVFSNTLAQYAKLIKALPNAASQVGSSLTKSNLPLAQKSAGKTSLQAKTPISLAPKTLFNVGLTAQRVFVTTRIPFDECRLMAKSIGASFNDIVLWICSTALRTYLAEHASIPTKPLIAAMPVSLRGKDNNDVSNKDLGNQAIMSLANLGTHIAHPGKRMAAIMASTNKVKEAMVNLKSVLPTDYPSFLAPWIVGGAARLALKTYGRGDIAQRLPLVANLVISNVPGPQVPLYLAGARFISFHPMSIVMHGLGLNITVQTYAGHVDFGIIAGKTALPHAQDLAKAIDAAFNEARNLYSAAQPAHAVRTERAKATPKASAKTSVKSPVKTPAAKVSRATKKLVPASKAPASKTKAKKTGTLR